MSRPQVLLFEAGHLRASLDEFDITPDRLVPMLAAHLPGSIGPRVENVAVTTLEPYRALLTSFVSGERSEERFEWAWLERLERDAAWRDDETYALLNGLFENPIGRAARAAQLVAIEFQARMAGRVASLHERAARMLAEWAQRCQRCGMAKTLSRMLGRILDDSRVSRLQYDLVRSDITSMRAAS